jgi:hypothetical protein
MYLVSPVDSRLTGFVDVGIGIAETPGLENFGKSRVPVTISGQSNLEW